MPTPIRLASVDDIEIGGEYFQFSHDQIKAEVRSIEFSYSDTPYVVYEVSDCITCVEASIFIRMYGVMPKHDLKYGDTFVIDLPSMSGRTYVYLNDNKVLRFGGSTWSTAPLAASVGSLRTYMIAADAVNDYSVLKRVGNIDSLGVSMVNLNN